MKSIAIIPARGGSKRIAKKNIKDLFGKPIISYVIETLKSTHLFDEIMVSTDDDEIAEISIKNGVKVPFKRSSENANDQAVLMDVLLEVIENYSKLGRSFDYVCCVLPTAALMSKNSIISSYKKLINENFFSVVPVIKFASPIQRALVEKDGLLKFNEPEYINTRSQDLPPFYYDSGQYYWLKVDEMVKHKKLFMENTGLVVLDELEAQDVDNLEDWEMLKLKLNRRPSIN